MGAKDIDANSLNSDDFARLFKRGAVGGVETGSSEKEFKSPSEEQELKIDINGRENDEDEFLDRKDKKKKKKEKRRKEKQRNPEIVKLMTEFEAISQTVRPEEEEKVANEGAGDKDRVIDKKETEIIERAKRMDVGYQRSRLHYLGHRQNLIQEGKDGLSAIDKDDYIVGKLRLIEDLMTLANRVGDLREVKDRLISVGVYVKDIENLFEKIKPLHEERQKLLQKFYEDGSREDLEKVEKEIGDIFVVDEMMERIKNGEKAQPRKENIKEEVKGGPKDLGKTEGSEKNKSELVNYMNKGFFDDLLMTTWGNWKESFSQEEANLRLQKVGVNLEDVYKKAGDGGVEIKKALISYMDHRNGDKKQNEPLLRALKREILLKLGLDVSVLDEKKVENADEKVKIEGIVPVEDKEREKYLEYLGGEFLDDLEVVYPRKEVKHSKEKKEQARKRYFVIHNFSLVTKPLDKKHPFYGKTNKEPRDYRVRDLLIEYFKLQEGTPRGWDVGLLEKMVGGDKERLRKLQEYLEEARKRNQEKGKKEKDKGEVKIDRDNFDFSGKTKAELYKMVPDGFNDPVKFFVAVNVIAGELDPRFPSVERAKKYFFDAVEGKEFILTPEMKQKLRDWLAIGGKIRRPGLPSEEDNLRELVDIGFDVNLADRERVREALDSIGFNKDDKEVAERYLKSLFADGGGEPKEPVVPKKTEFKEGEESEEIENERWMKVVGLLEKLGSVTGEERKTLYLEIESHGVRIRGTISDLIEAGANEDDIKNSFRHMANMAKVWKMGEEKARREYPKMVEKYASMARLLRLKWYN
ncbi:hypothetical protein A2572_00820 [Candidatus Collierbacteria bacterium RIFOXYD1_FULL_40_9]|uniref:UBA domain-containing protein n=1 Tax=Candidatus Collierbacteria bacterium RIFOXYD1_FULL_40_9 TaxID=1817731 RepID=A0A1F5FVV0_9BACT|nr:MAG: hypothetical protein A2572_00820 [Candidatus Collierbacteria bacterium RIFOXYD1_FULL_40_9]